MIWLSELKGMKICIFISLSSFLAFNAEAQLDAALSFQKNVCVDESFYISNTSSQAETYLWDFCFEDLSSAPLYQLTDSYDDILSAPEAIATVYDKHKWYAFILGRDNNTLIRLDYEDSLKKTLPSVTNLGNISGLLSNPSEISLINESGQWYGLILNSGNDRLLRLSFGASLTNVPTVVSLGNLDGWSAPRGLDILSYNNNQYAFVTDFNRNTLTLIEFGSTITNSPTVSRVITNDGTLNRPFGVSIKVVDGKWYGLVASYSGNSISHLSFGSNPQNTPTIFNFTGISLPTQVVLAIEGNKLYGLISARNNGIYRINYEEGLDSPSSASVENIGNFNKQLSNIFDLKIEKNEGTYVLFAISSTGALSRLDFEGSCPYVNMKTSELLEPKNISFSQSGNYPITLTAYDEFGNRDDTTQFITVTEDQAPTIDFQLSSQCISSTSSIISSADQTLSSADWTINSDTRTGETITYDFTTPGTYPVTLEVESDNGCGQRLTKEVTIYEPPDPSFALPAGQVCTNGAVALTNQTDAKGADTDSLITYQWWVDGELVSEQENPSIVFDEGGNKTLRLAASIPGCTETYETTVNVIQGPTVDFALPAQLCAGEVITLENQTSGNDITGYEWAFGDGGTLETLSAEAVEYTFAKAGTYDIALVANTSLGCANVLRQTVTVYEQPTVGFTSDVACAGVVTLFTDTTTAGSNANIIGWNWDFGDGSALAEERNPSHSYPQAGTYPVSLTTLSSGGCTSTTTKNITVVSPVSPGFTAERVCPTEDNPFSYQFADSSTVVSGEIIVQRLWTINGNNFTEDAVAYQFTEPGTYEVSLTAFASSGCNAIHRESVEVRALPQVRFAAATTCVGEPVVLANQSTLNGWEVARYFWDVSSVGTVLDESPTVVFTEAGEFPVTLTVETKTGCTFSWDSTVVIQSAPLAAFEVAQLSGGAPLTVNPTNVSANYSQVQWTVNGELVSEEVLPSLVLDEVGTYELALVAQNDIGCADTTRQTIEVVSPTLDIAVRELLRRDSDDASPQLVLSLENRGTLVASGMEVLVQLGDVVALTEPIDETLLPGQRLNYPLQTTLADLRNQRTPVEYICAAISIRRSAGENLRTISESDTTNNRACLSLSAPLLVETPFPNPADDEVVVSVLLERAEAVQLRLISATGELVLARQLPNAQPGLNTVLLDVSQTPAGTYTLEVTAAGQTVSRRVIVRP